MLSLIAVIGKNRELGYRGQLLWKIPGDLPRFKRITLGHPVIMGRKTQPTFQYNGGPLPGRTNIVVTRDTSFSPAGFVVVHDIDAAVAAASASPGSDEIFVIGGASLYAQTIARADRLYLTLVDRESAGADAFFPEFGRFRTVVNEETADTDGMRIVYRILEPARPASL